MKVWIATLSRMNPEILGIWTTKGDAEAQIADFRRVDKEEYPKGKYAFDAYVIDEYEVDVYLEHPFTKRPSK